MGFFQTSLLLRDLNYNSPPAVSRTLTRTDRLMLTPSVQPLRSFDEKHGTEGRMLSSILL